MTELYPKKAIVVCDLYSGETKCVEGRVTAVRFAMDKALGAGT